MREKAFIVKPESELYKQYFRDREEMVKFNNAARAFNEKYSVCKSATFGLSKNLAAEMTREEKKRFSGQIRKRENKWGLSEFMKRSEMQKCWEDEVACKVDFDVISKQRTWFFEYISSGRWQYNMWHHGEVLYGHLASENDSEINLSDEMQEIKMSEYYRIIEIVKEEQNNGK